MLQLFLEVVGHPLHFFLEDRLVARAVLTHTALHAAWIVILEAQMRRTRVCLQPAPRLCAYLPCHAAAHRRTQAAEAARLAEEFRLLLALWPRRLRGYTGDDALGQLNERGLLELVRHERHLALGLLHALHYSLKRLARLCMQQCFRL